MCISTISQKAFTAVFDVSVLTLPYQYVSVLEVKRGCATAVSAVAASAYKVIKLRFIYIVSKLAAQM